jgi:hypothetical protein
MGAEVLYQEDVNGGKRQLGIAHHTTRRAHTHWSGRHTKNHVTIPPKYTPQRLGAEVSYQEDVNGGKRQLGIAHDTTRRAHTHWLGRHTEILELENGGRGGRPNNLSTLTLWVNVLNRGRPHPSCVFK